MKKNYQQGFLGFILLMTLFFVLVGMFFGIGAFWYSKGDKGATLLRNFLDINKYKELVGEEKKTIRTP